MWEKFLFSWFLVWLPLIFSGIIILLAVLNNSGYKKINFFVFSNKKLIIAFLLGTVLFKIFLSGLQYLVWQQSAFSHFFLPPFTPISYFLKYSFFHFWLNGSLTLITALLLFLIFRLIKKYRVDIISQQELSLLLLSSLLIAWPKIIIFIPFLFLSSLLFLIFNLLVKKQGNIKMTWQ